MCTVQQYSSTSGLGWAWSAGAGRLSSRQCSRRGLHFCYFCQQKRIRFHAMQPPRAGNFCVYSSCVSFASPRWPGLFFFVASQRLTIRVFSQCFSMSHAQPAVASGDEVDPDRLNEREPKRSKTKGQRDATLPCPEQTGAELAAANLCAIVFLQLIAFSA